MIPGLENFTLSLPLSLSPSPSPSPSLSTVVRLKTFTSYNNIPHQITDFPQSHLLFATSNVTCTLSLTAQRPKNKFPGTVISALGSTARIGTEKWPPCCEISRKWQLVLAAPVWTDTDPRQRNINNLTKFKTIIIMAAVKFGIKFHFLTAVPVALQKL